jgi:TonB family protein
MLLRRTALLGMLVLGAGCAPVKHDPVKVPAGIVFRTKPHFPAQAIRQAHEGTVVVLVLVGVNGMPLNVTIEKSSRYRELDRAAIAAVREWRYKPETIDGVPVEGYLRVPLNYNFGSEEKAIRASAANRPLLQYYPPTTTPSSAQGNQNGGG